MYKDADILGHPLKLQMFVSYFAGQSANVGMLPPSDSEDEEEEEEEKPAPVKAKQVNGAHKCDVVLLLASQHLLLSADRIYDQIYDHFYAQNVMQFVRRR